MTEDEAKTKRCPLVSGKHYNAFTGVQHRQMYESNRWDGGTYCIGSACMMWRDGLDRVLTGREIVVDHGVKKTIEKESVPSGYCGLAGKP